jgi:uncharacterized membrane protein YeaQ/YmgE (transglycosylase-associated protein family)
MIGLISWLVCGAVAGFLVSHLVSASDKGLVMLTLGVGAGGSIVGGFVASLLHFGDVATFSFYALLFAFVGAAAALVSYRWALKI